MARRVKEYVSLASRQNRLQARPAPHHTAGACPSGRLEAWRGWPVTCEWDGATRALCLPAARSRVHTCGFVTHTAGCVNSLLPGSGCWRLLPFRRVLSFSRSCNCLDSLSGRRTDGAEARLMCPDTRPSGRGHPHQRQHRLHCGKAHTVAGVRFLGCGDPTRGKRLFYFKSLKSPNRIKVFQRKKLNYLLNMRPQLKCPFPFCVRRNAVTADTHSVTHDVVHLSTAAVQVL